MSEKPLLRAELKRKRAYAQETLGNIAPRQVADRFLAAFDLSGATEVAVYWPFGSEMDPLPLAEKLNAAGIAMSLPVVAEKEHPLVFRRWRPGDDLTEGAYDIPAPVDGVEEVVPTIVIVPMLGFARDGVRLGYGGGFYDRTLAQLAERGSVLAIGLAYSGQECEVSAEAHDYRLDAIVTEREVIHVSTTPRAE